MTEIITRTQWGATPWRDQPYSVAMSERDWFLVHYHGGPPRNDRGDANAKEIEEIHLSNGWSGVGYNFIVGQDGAIREGRGWSLAAARPWPETTPTSSIFAGSGTTCAAWPTSVSPRSRAVTR